MKHAITLFSIAALAVATLSVQLVGQEAADKPSAKAAAAQDDKAVERTRDVVKMLDDIYKQTIILITDKYVHTEDDFAAGSAAVELFRRIGESGSHQVRLLDVTGDPYDAENVAKSDFEKKAVEQVKKGKGYVEQITTKDGQQYLQAMTAVPVVLERCIMCHPHYADVEKGAAIGAISYELPIK